LGEHLPGLSGRRGARYGRQLQHARIGAHPETAKTLNINTGALAQPTDNSTRAARGGKKNGRKHLWRCSGARSRVARRAALNRQAAKNRRQLHHTLDAAAAAGIHFIFVCDEMNPDHPSIHQQQETWTL
jgi:hypothetical protein